MEKAGDDSLEMQARSLCWNISPRLCRADPSPHFQSWVCSGCRSRSAPIPGPVPFPPGQNVQDGRTDEGRDGFHAESCHLLPFSFQAPLPPHPAARAPFPTQLPIPSGWGWDQEPLAKCLSDAVTNSAQAASSRAKPNLFQCIVLCFLQKGLGNAFSWLGARGGPVPRAGRRQPWGSLKLCPKNPLQIPWSWNLALARANFVLGVAHTPLPPPPCHPPSSAADGKLPRAPRCQGMLC